MAEIGRFMFLLHHVFDNKATEKECYLYMCLGVGFMDVFATVWVRSIFTWNLKINKKRVAGLVLLVATSLLGLLNSFSCNILRID